MIAEEPPARFAQLFAVGISVGAFACLLPRLWMLFGEVLSGAQNVPAAHYLFSGLALACAVASSVAIAIYPGKRPRRVHILSILAILQLALSILVVPEMLPVSCALFSFVAVWWLSCATGLGVVCLVLAASGQPHVLASESGPAGIAHLPTILTTLQVGLGLTLGLSARSALHYENRVIIATRELKISALNAIQAAVAEERNRISHLLHDQLRHSLAVASINVEQLKQDTSDSESLARLGAIRSELQSVETSVDHLMIGLDEDLTVEALLVKLPQAISHPKIVTIRHGLAPFLAVEKAPQLESSLARALQELVTNAIRHADARVVCIELHRSAEMLRMSVVDDGSCERVPIAGKGLSLIQAKIGRWKGAVALDVEPAGGLRVAINLPLPLQDTHETPGDR